MLAPTLILGLTALLLTIVLTRRAVGLVGQAMTRERTARSEAEALAELTACVAAGKDIQDTLNAAVHAAARLFGGDVRCTVLLPSADGLLRLAAYNNESSLSIAGFAFRPGEGFNGRAYSEGRLIRVDDLRTHPLRRPDVGRVSAMKSMMVAPLIAEQRTLGVISAITPLMAAFGEHQEEVFTAIARNVAVALAAAEAREAAQREAAMKATIIAQMTDGLVVADRQGTIIECNAAAAELLDLQPSEVLALAHDDSPWQLFGADGELLPNEERPLWRAVAGETLSAEYRLMTHSGLERWVLVSASPLRTCSRR